MKKSILLLIGMLVLIATPLMAQDYPKTELFGGFSVMSFGGGGDRVNPLGFQASIAGNLSQNFGIVGDFGAQFKNGEHVIEYMGGPRFTSRMETASVFAHALFGGMTIGNGDSESAFAMGFGGGVDVSIDERFAIRVIQFDWIPVVNEGNWSNDQIRFGFGIVIK